VLNIGPTAFLNTFNTFVTHMTLNRGGTL